jgi:hypothetical protein
MKEALAGFKELKEKYSGMHWSIQFWSFGFNE